MLIELRDYIEVRGRVSMRDLAWHFQTEPDAIRGMLEHWIRKGRIVREAACPPCGSGCCNCDTELTEIYVGTQGAGIPLDSVVGARISAPAPKRQAS